jgi:hypothetical protein
MKVLVSCTENPNFFNEVLDELELFIDKKVIFDEKNVRRSAVCRPPRRGRSKSVYRTNVFMEFRVNFTLQSTYESKSFLIKDFIELSY